MLRILRETAGPLTIAEIADRLGIHSNTVRFHLARLLDTGHVERASSGARAPGRPPQLFQAVRGMDPLGPQNYRLLAEILLDGITTQPNASMLSLEAGRAWGRQRASALTGTTESDTPAAAGEAEERLLRLLDEWGFAPEHAIGGDRRKIELRHCPFLELSSSRSEIVCPIHLGLMQGAMESWRAPVTVDRLDPFVEPDLCRAHLSPVGVS